MATPKSEVYQWLCSISNGLELERLAGEFESRGFRTVDSLKYIKSPDLDVLFPSPHKLMMAEKRIIESEIEKVKSLKSGQLPPRQLFPAVPRQVTTSRATSWGRRKDRNTNGQRGNKFNISYKDISVVVAENNSDVKQKC